MERKMAFVYNSIEDQVNQIRHTILSMWDYHEATFSWKLLYPRLEKELINQGYKVVYGPPNTAWPKESFTVSWTANMKMFKIPEDLKASWMTEPFAFKYEYGIHNRCIRCDESNNHLSTCPLKK